MFVSRKWILYPLVIHTLAIVLSMLIFFIDLSKWLIGATILLAVIGVLFCAEKAHCPFCKGRALTFATIYKFGTFYLWGDRKINCPRCGASVAIS